MSDYITYKKIQRGWETVQNVYNQTLQDGKPLGFIGGSYASFMAGEISGIRFVVMPNDIDIFGTTRDNTEKIVENLEANGYHIYQVSNDRIWHMSWSAFPNTKKMDVQVIQPNPAWLDDDDGKFRENLINDFDLSTSRSIVVDDKWIMCDSSMDYFEAKILRINNPFRSLKRVLKYRKRGFSFRDEELIKIFKAWDALSPERKAEIIASTEPEIYIQPPDYEFAHEDDWFEGE